MGWLPARQHAAATEPLLPGCQPLTAIIRMIGEPAAFTEVGGGAERRLADLPLGIFRRCRALAVGSAGLAPGGEWMRSARLLNDDCADPFGVPAQSRMEIGRAHV